MTNYVKTTDYAVKDSLTTGDPSKIIKGTEINTEFNNIQQAIATKADLSSPNFLGNPTAVTQPLGDNSNRLATTAFVASTVDSIGSDVNITGGTIQGVTISNLANALQVDIGGTGRVAIPVGNVVLGNGTAPLQDVAPGASGNVLTSNGTTWQSSAPPAGGGGTTSIGLGIGQTWQNVSTSRALGVTYTNSTDKPIQVHISVTSTVTDALNQPSGGVLRAFINGAIFADSGFRLASTSGTSNASSFSLVIPVGTTYRFEMFAGSSTSTLWWELR